MGKVDVGMTRHVFGESGVEFRIDEDGDALGLVRLRHYEPGEKTPRFESCMTLEEAEAVAAQLIETVRFLRAHKA